MSRNQKAQDIADDWLKWLRTKSFFSKPMPKHILAVLSMPDTSGEPPDAKLSAELACFHMGVIGLPDEIGRAFLRVYCDFPDKPIKLLSYQEGVSRQTYYDRAHQGATTALRTMRDMIEKCQVLT